MLGRQPTLGTGFSSQRIEPSGVCRICPAPSHSSAIATQGKAAGHPFRVKNLAADHSWPPIEAVSSSLAGTSYFEAGAGLGGGVRNVVSSPSPVSWHFVRSAGRSAATVPAMPHGAMLIGWGVFNLVEDVINHHLLGLHRVHEYSTAGIRGDLAFLTSGLLRVLAGATLTRCSGQRSRLRVGNGWHPSCSAC